MLIEEMSECIMALQKFKRDMASDKVGSVCEEIADVSIMVDQMNYVFNKDKIAKYKDFKLQRLAKSLENATSGKYDKRTDQDLSDAVKSH
jgi:NTP pyrophosphatase (non-canonical NTP hydrolase)